MQATMGGHQMAWIMLEHSRGDDTKGKWYAPFMAANACNLEGSTTDENDQSLHSDFCQIVNKNQMAREAVHATYQWAL